MSNILSYSMLIIINLCLLAAGMWLGSRPEFVVGNAKFVFEKDGLMMYRRVRD